MKSSTRFPLRSFGLAAVLVALSCASAGPATWVSGTPAELLHNTARRAEEARFILRDHTEVTLVAPRLVGDRVEAAAVSSCAGGRCDAIQQTLSLRTRHIAWMSARYATVAVAREVEAQPPDPQTDRAPEPPRSHVDLLASLGGIIPVGAGAYGGNAGIGIELRALSARGFGGSLAFRAAGPLSFDLLSRNAQSPSITMLSVDIAAIYRARLVGDGRTNTAITLGAGLSLTSLEGDAGRAAATCPYLAWNCVEPVYTPPPRTFDNGARVLPLAVAALDTRVNHFLIGLGATWRGDFSGEAPLQIFTVSLNVGASF